MPARPTAILFLSFFFIFFPSFSFSLFFSFPKSMKSNSKSGTNNNTKTGGRAEIARKSRNHAVSGADGALGNRAIQKNDAWKYQGEVKGPRRPPGPTESETETSYLTGGSKHFLTILDHFKNTRFWRI